MTTGVDILQLDDHNLQVVLGTVEGGDEFLEVGLDTQTDGFEVSIGASFAAPGRYRLSLFCERVGDADGSATADLLTLPKGIVPSLWYAHTDLAVLEGIADPARHALVTTIPLSQLAREGLDPVEETPAEAKIVPTDLEEAFEKIAQLERTICALRGDVRLQLGTIAMLDTERGMLRKKADKAALDALTVTAMLEGRGGRTTAAELCNALVDFGWSRSDSQLAIQRAIGSYHLVVDGDWSLRVAPRIADKQATD